MRKPIIVNEMNAEFFVGKIVRLKGKPGRIGKVTGVVRHTSWTADTVTTAWELLVWWPKTGNNEEKPSELEINAATRASGSID